MSVTVEETSFATLRDSGVLLLFGEITEETSKECVAWILEMNLTLGTKHNHKVLSLVINSPGGEMSHAYSIIDTMRGSSIPIYTIGMGEICSAGLMIFMSGVNRTITPNTSIMTHQYNWGSSGKHHELIAATKEFNHSHRRMIEHYKECTKLDEETIIKDLLTSTDVWLSAEEAKKYNLCDEIKLLKPIIRS